VTYDLGDGRYATFDAHVVKRYGAAALLREVGAEMPTGRLPVIQCGRRVGTLPAAFEPVTARSTTFMYEPRHGDFRREGDTWVAASNLGPGDLEAVTGFVWDHVGVP
jgi:hypothetical protein